MLNLRWFRWRLGGALLLSAALLSSCSFEGPQSAFDVAGPIARQQKELFMLTFWLAMGILAVVAGILIYSMWRFRARRSDHELPPQTHGNSLLEVIWTVIPVIILIIILVPTVIVIFETESYVEAEEEDLVVNVIGHQWWWSFEYPQLGIVTANELHIPEDTQVIFNLKSADVLHSFWAPSLAGKRDLIPNQNNQLWFVGAEPGIYFGQCAELCLDGHAYMKFRVMVETEDKFNKWVATFKQEEVQNTAENPLVQQGSVLFQRKGCAGCHAIQGVATGDVGPNLTNFGLRNTVAAGVLKNTPENLATWLRDPAAVKPNLMPDLGLSEDEIDALVAYLLSLGADTEQAVAGVGHE